mmetsp:Transcript_51409/g.137202  ORF Transcript_51409/g.137202 Transcript_51409/m.137202 type:complete len:282 (-) Transcript_51409:103-948(-)
MDASGFAPLLETEEFDVRQASVRRLRRVLGAAAPPSLFLLFTVAGLQYFLGGTSFFANYMSAAEVPTLSNGTLNTYSGTFPTSCFGQPDGLAWIKPDGDRAFQVICKDGWLLMQTRTGPSVNFHRDWTSYRIGFGDATNFWLGNDNIHAVTLSGARLRVVLMDANDTVKYAEYSTFSVAGENDFYRVLFDDYSGTAGDALTYHSGCNFSTWDADHDKSPSDNCAEECFGGWWYNACHKADLNGLYEGPGHMSVYGTGIVWYPVGGPYYSMKSCHMWVQSNE